MNYEELIIKNEGILNELQIGKNLAESTLRGYKYVLNQYCMFHQKTLAELIEVPQIPALVVESFERYEDIPTKEDIRYAVMNTSNLRTKTMILFLASSGCAINEMNSITIKEFIHATKYHKETKIENVLKELEPKTVIPTFQLVRQKTHYSYYCFCTPEAVNYIILMLKKRLEKRDISSDEPLWIKLMKWKKF